MIQIRFTCVQAGVGKHEAFSGTGRGAAFSLKVALLAPAGMTEPLDAAAQARLLVRVATLRDRQAFALLFKHFAPRLKAFHLRAALSDTLAEELTQETMLLLWRKAESFDPARAGVATWVFTITRNLRIDHARRRRGAVPRDWTGEETAPSAETVSLEGEQARRVRAALAGLPHEQRRVIELSFFTETPHAGIATALNLPLGTVKSRIRLALARLRDALEAE